MFVPVGMFENDLRNGKGVLHHSNGDTYEGDWHDGHIHGQVGLSVYSWHAIRTICMV